MAEYLDGQGAQRQNSVRSIASNTSAASGVSLTRRARTRARSKTLTAPSSPRLPTSLPNSPTSELPYLGVSFTQEPPPLIPALDARSRPVPSRSSSPDAVQPPLRDGYMSSGHQADRPLIAFSVEGSAMYQRPAKLSSQTSGMPVLPTATNPQPPPSAFSRDPTLTGVDPSHVNVRDSISTQLSGLSSSVYPPSTSTTSGPDSPLSPRSMVDQEHSYEISSYDPEVGEAEEYDGDDVSYRLRLLVNNSYFLPPAHSKPSLADFAAMENNIQKKPVKPPTPTFFDLFRGKAKSKPPTPTNNQGSGFDPAGPVLRTAADSITTAHALGSQPRSSSQIPRGAPPGARTGRVVVVREKMHDLAVAAKQAEQDMKSRGARRDQDAQGAPNAFNNVIDPTDAVDLPPPSSDYPFAVQASALHGLGVHDSLGAALLADRLPPPQSPGMSSMFDAEDDWRKVLLHQAVHHSLDSMSPDVSFSMMQGPSTPAMASPRPGPSERSPHTPRPPLERRIISNPRFSDTSPPVISRKKSSQSVGAASATKGYTFKKPPSLDTSRPLSQYTPLRSATPSAPLTPLTPAPRKHLITPVYSTSQTEPNAPETQGKSSRTAADGPSRLSMRKTMSSSGVSDAYDSDPRDMLLTPPPLPTPSFSVTSFSEMQSRSRATSQSFSTDHEMPDEDDALMPRHSVAFSAVAGRAGRQSLSEHSQPSPTMSTFHDASADTPDRSSDHSQWRPSVDHNSPSSRDSPVARYSAMSPPPRISSSLAHVALSPPPRFHYQSLQPHPSSSPHTSDVDARSGYSAPLTDDTTLIIHAPEPTTPPLPISQRRGNPPGRLLSLDIPSHHIPVAIHSAPGPSSPTSFFDSLQSQPNAMDDLESSDESDDEDTTCLNPPIPIRDPRTRSMSITPASPRSSSFMRLGNHSTPYVSHTSSPMPRSPLGFKNKPPVGNTPVRAPFFTERSGRGDQSPRTPVSSFDFYRAQQSQQDLTLGASEASPESAKGKTSPLNKRRSTVGPSAMWKRNPKAQESLKKLDGLLLQHMETEKDTIKRIATTARSNIPPEHRW
ncbi:hypothetical protein H0H81_008966 [Sphagnurus paluster]|uniref:Uncharacterized protein n=1 Tax=Sphagnurus paluster TaxID=117069 RepID=A0A9P7G138_9AGAR|nr:hypothetical protein H0H81_008966 [Sphagnurus paluster]